MVTSTGVVFDGVAPPVVLMTCSITPTPPRETVSRSWKWMPDPVGASKARKLEMTASIKQPNPASGLATQYGYSLWEFQVYAS